MLDSTAGLRKLGTENWSPDLAFVRAASKVVELGKSSRERMLPEKLEVQSVEPNCEEVCLNRGRVDIWHGEER